MASEDASDGRRAGRPRLVAPGVADLPRETSLARLAHHPKLGRGNIHSDLAVVGLVGSYLRQAYTAVGIVANLAARLENLTKELDTDLLISGAVERRQAPFRSARTVSLGTHEIKGMAHRIEVYRVDGPCPPGERP